MDFLRKTKQIIIGFLLVQDCKIHHSAREGDLWAESRYMGFRSNYYACMEGAVYDITEWANCQVYSTWFHLFISSRNYIANQPYFDYISYLFAIITLWINSSIDVLIVDYIQYWLIWLIHSGLTLVNAGWTPSTFTDKLASSAISNRSRARSAGSRASGSRFGRPRI